jgi:hypothetical protein
VSESPSHFQVAWHFLCSIQSALDALFPKNVIAAIRISKQTIILDPLYGLGTVPDRSDFTDDRIKFTMFILISFLGEVFLERCISKSNIGLLSIA